MDTVMIEELRLGEPVVRALRAGGLKTVGDIRVSSLATLVTLPNFPIRGLREIGAALADLGVDLTASA